MPNRFRTLTALLLAAVIYYLLARLGLLLALAQSNASPIWPPSGFALFLLLRFGRQYWPAVLVGAFCANLAVFQNNQVASLPVVLAASLAISLGNTAESLVARWLVQRCQLATLALRSQREVYKLVGVVAVSAAVSAAVGVLTLRVTDIIPAAITVPVTATWWVGDFLGLLLLAPLAMALPMRPSWPRLRAAQLVFLLTLTVATLAIFMTNSHATNTQLLPYALLLFLGLAAVQRWRGLVKAALVIIAGVAIPATVLEHGPFVSGVLHHSLLSLCTFLAISTVLSLILATDEEQERADAYFWTPILTLLACMALTTGAWAWITRDTEQRTRERFEQAAIDAGATIRTHIESYESLLRAGTALFNASTLVERDEWQRFVGSLQLSSQFPGVLGAGFARFLPGGALLPGVAQIRRDSQRDFHLWPEGKRDLYVPIVYLEPENERNQHAIGYDMMSEPVRREALLAAMQSGKMTATGPVILVQEIKGPKQVGFLMFNPVYSRAANGKHELFGFVYSPFRMGDLMQGIFGKRLQDIRLDIHFGSPDGSLLYSSAEQGSSPSYLRLSSIQQVEIGDHLQSWSLVMTPTASFDASVDQGKSFLVLVMGTLISLLFFGVSRNLVQQRQEAVRAHDFSTRQLRQQAASLEESEARFKLLTSHIRNHAIVLLDAKGTISTWNEGAEKLFGYQDADIVGQPVERLQAGAGHGDALARALAHGQDEVTDLRRRKDGSSFLALTQLFPVRDEAGECIGYAMILRDVTAEKAAEKELNDAKTQAESASAAKSAFVANISHELRTPMNAVLGLTQILGHTPLNAEQRQYLDMVSGAGKSLLALLNDVLDFSKIEANKLELVEDDFLLDDVLDALAGIMAMSAPEKGLALSLCVEADVPLSLHGDMQRVQQVLLNLVSNALKFTEAGSVTVHAARDAHEPGMLRWEVTDTGIGISADQQQRLFSPFSQGDASMARRYGGTGLGLAISQRLAQLMTGRIELRSKPGAGATFSFLMPLRGGARPDPYAMPPDRSGWRVLYADPDDRRHQDMVQLVGRWRWQCDTVTSADAMQQALARRHYDLLLYDASLAQAGRAARGVAHHVCLRSSVAPDVLRSAAAADPELLRPLTRSALFQALALQNAAPAAQPRPAVAAAATRPAPAQALAGLSILLAEDNPMNQLVARSMLEAAGATVHIVENGAWPSISCVPDSPPWTWC